MLIPTIILLCLVINRFTLGFGGAGSRDGFLAKILLYNFTCFSRVVKLQKYSPFNFTIFCGFYDITRYQRGRANCFRFRFEWVDCSVFKKICFKFCQMYYYSFYRILRCCQLLFLCVLRQTLQKHSFSFL